MYTFDGTTMDVSTKRQTVRTCEVITKYLGRGSSKENTIIGVVWGEGAGSILTGLEKVNHHDA